MSDKQVIDDDKQVIDIEKIIKKKPKRVIPERRFLRFEFADKNGDIWIHNSILKANQK